MPRIALSYWPMLLITFLTITFFVEGVYLEMEAAKHGIRRLFDRTNGDAAALKELVSFQAERIGRIHQMATAAIDLSKIGLGAIVVLATQLLTSTQAESNDSKR